MANRASTLLDEMQKLRYEYGPGRSVEKRALLTEFGARRLPSADEVYELHEILCFWRAYPDDRSLLKQVEAMLGTFQERSDLGRHRRGLADTGIAGTVIHYPFYWFTAEWMTHRWADRLFVDWRDFDQKDKLEEILHLLVSYSETPALDELDDTLEEWIRFLKGPNETDATFLIRRFGALVMDPFAKETIYESFDIPMRIEPDAHTPSRTHARYPRSRITYQRKPLMRSRPELLQEIQRPPDAIRSLSPREGQALIDLARESMVTRSRDLDVFVHADRRDIRMVELGNGLQLVLMGATPARRLLLEAVYGFLTLKNGVPIGYVLNSALFNSAAVAYNVFETFRGGESAHVYGRILATLREVFAADAFAVDPYQLGHQNSEGLKSGAWWFYYKLGFRPHDPDVKRVLRVELARMKTNPKHRSSIATLNELTAEHMFLYLGSPRKDVLGRVSTGPVGLEISRYLADRFGSDRERGLDVCSGEAAELLGRPSLEGFSPGEKLAWRQWSPLVMILPGIETWDESDRQGLIEVIRAKGGRRESDFVLRFDAHARLRAAVLDLAR